MITITTYFFPTSPTCSRVINYYVVSLVVQSIFTILRPFFKTNTVLLFFILFKYAFFGIKAL